MSYITEIVNSSSCDNPTVGEANAFQRFTLWALATLEISVVSTAEGDFVLSIPDRLQERYGEVAGRRFSFASEGETGEEQGLVERLTTHSPLFSWIVDKLKQQGAASQAQPRRQPASVHELTPVLFGSYKIEEGSVRLAGCVLEPRPLLRLTYRHGEPSLSNDQSLLHAVVSLDGDIVNEQTMTRLYLSDLVPLEGKPPKSLSSDITSWIDSSQQIVRSQLSKSGTEFLLATVVWCDFSEGKLSFEIKEKSVELPFSGWAQMIVDEAIKPPPFRCSESGKQSYHLTATDDGRITVNEAIAKCEISKSRVLQSDLRQCAVTEKWVLPEYLKTCPVNQEQVIEDAMVACSLCHQSVSPSALRGDRCAACRNVKSVTKSEPRMARVLGEYPKLDRWRDWKLSETSTVYILIGAAYLQRLLIVVEKETLQPLQLATGSRVIPGWSEVPNAQWDQHLHGGG